jgi:hypothetical protein
MGKTGMTGININAGKKKKLSAGSFEFLKCMQPKQIL